VKILRGIGNADGLMDRHETVAVDGEIIRARRSGNLMTEGPRWDTGGTNAGAGVCVTGEWWRTGNGAEVYVRR